VNFLLSCPIIIEINNNGKIKNFLLFIITISRSSLFINDIVKSDKVSFNLKFLIPQNTYSEGTIYCYFNTLSHFYF